MKYQNWKSYLNKSLYLLFLALAVLILKFLPEKVTSDELNVNYFLNGMILLYGLALILIYLIINKKYLYLVKYGLIYIIYGAVLMFISPTIEGLLIDHNIHFIAINSFNNLFDQTYYEIIIIIVMFLHGLFKLIFSDTYSKLVRVIEIFVGIIFILTSLLFLYTDIHALRENINIDFLNNVSRFCVVILFILVLVDTLLFVFRLIKNRKFIKEEIEEQILESRATFRKGVSEEEGQIKRKRKYNEDVEVIDLERFFSKDKQN